MRIVNLFKAHVLGYSKAALQLGDVALARDIAKLKHEQINAKLMTLLRHRQVLQTDIMEQITSSSRVRAQNSRNLYMMDKSISKLVVQQEKYQIIVNDAGLLSASKLLEKVSRYDFTAKDKRVLKNLQTSYNNLTRKKSYIPIQNLTVHDIKTKSSELIERLANLLSARQQLLSQDALKAMHPLVADHTSMHDNFLRQEVRLVQAEMKVLFVMLKSDVDATDRIYQNDFDMLKMLYQYLDSMEVKYKASMSAQDLFIHRDIKADTITALGDLQTLYIKRLKASRK